MPLYFAFGSNMSHAQMRARCAGARLTGRARLEGFGLAFTRFSKRWNGGVADIVERAGHSVWGLVYEMTLSDVAALDRYEGHPDHYARFEVTVHAEAGPVLACAYAVVKKQDFVTPASSYLLQMIAAAEEHAFPDAYVSALRSFGAPSER